MKTMFQRARAMLSCRCDDGRADETRDDEYRTYCCDDDERVDGECHMRCRV